uniref:SRCR domain-containing protein n=1 Tax=Amphimedon queenslandica TaxID=400682 RepID=A0A1X7VFW6_AMPQE
TTRIWNNPYSGQIRLVGGTYSSYGRLEVYCNGQWGTVCDHSFGATDARVACRQLGYSDYSTYTGNLAGPSSQPIWLNNVTCSSTSNCLATCESCPATQYHNCGHSEDVALGCDRGTVRLVRSGVFSSTYTAGIVQIYYFTSSSSTNRWGNICDDTSFASTEASVICNQLGYDGASFYGRAGSTTSYGTDTAATVLDDVNCFSSSYLTLQQCSLSTIIKSSCTSDSEDAYVSCYTTRIWNNPYSGQIRLQGGTYSSYGRLEVYCNGQWGTVCDDSFGSTDARVACRQLGYSDYSTYTGNLAGSSSQPIWLDNVICTSSTSTCLAYCESCPSSQYHNCIHSEDVALGCEFDSSYTSSTNTLSTCQYADSLSSVTSSIAAIIGGVIAGIVVCIAIIVAIPICICCCLGVGIGAAARGSNRTTATVVTGAATTTDVVAVSTTTTNTSNLAAPPPPAYDQQPPPPAAYPATGYDAEKAPYPPQQGYPAQPGYPPQQGYPAQPGYPPQQQGYGYPPPY